MHTSGHLFSGGWGDGRGFMNAGYAPVFGANHDPASVATARANVPGIYVREAAIQTIDMRTLPSCEVLVGSPICWESTPAGGNSKARVQDELDFGDNQNRKRSDWGQTRMTAWEPVRYVEVHGRSVLAYCGENVPGFATRNRRLFDAWLAVWDALGFYPTLASVNAAHISVETPDGLLGPLPQYRDRLVWAMVRKDIGRVPDLRPRPASICPNCGPVEGIQHWPGKPSGRRVGSYNPRLKADSTARQSYYYVCPTERCHARVEPITRGIGEVIDPDVRGHRFGDGRRDRPGVPYEDATRARVEDGLQEFGGKPFVITLRNHGGATSLDAPIGTVTAQGGEHHYLVRPTADMTVDDCEYRPLKNPEKARTQGFPAHHPFAGSESDIGRQVGNAVAVTVATFVAQRTKAVLPS